MTTEPRPDACPLADTGFDPYHPDLTEPAIWDVYAQLHAAGPVAWSSAHGGFYIVTGFSDVRAALRDPAVFSSASGHRIPTDGSQTSIPIDFDPPLHTEYRALFAPALAPARVRALEPFLRTRIEGLVDDFIATDGGDFVGAVALPLPLAVLVEVVGFSEETVARFRAVTERLWGRFGAGMTFAEAAAEIGALMRGEMRDHAATRPDDFVTWLLDAEVDGRPIRDDEVVSALASLAVAGHETTMNASSALVFLLAADPRLQDRLRADAGVGPRIVEEMLRLRSPAQNFARRTTRDVEVAGVGIPAGSAVLLSFAAANRDPAQFPKPEHFDLDRPSGAHLAFGWGVHQCVGAALARLELRILLETLRARAPFRLAGAPRWSPLQAGNHLGLTTLPITFDQHSRERNS
jgi:cytochrome P450